MNHRIFLTRVVWPSGGTFGNGLEIEMMISHRTVFKRFPKHPLIYTAVKTVSKYLSRTIPQRFL